MNFALKGLTFASLVFLFFIMVSPLLSTPVSADEGRCCFQRGENPEHCHDLCLTDRQVKNDCTGSGSDVPGGCHQCTGGLEATACGGSGSNTNFCNYLGVTPATSKITVGQTLPMTISVQQGTWDKIAINNSNPAIAVASPTQFLGKSVGNAPQVYQYLNFSVKGVKAGSVYMSVDQYAYYPGYLNLYCSKGFTVNVVPVSSPKPTPTPTPPPSTPPSSCIPGARCDVVGNGRLVSGSSVQCSMPRVVNAPAGAGMTYDLSCTYVNTQGATVGSPITKTVTNPTTTRAVFEMFAVNNTSGKYKCAFRSCTTVSGVKTCTAWGK